MGVNAQNGINLSTVSEYDRYTP